MTEITPEETEQRVHDPQLFLADIPEHADDNGEVEFEKIRYQALVDAYSSRLDEDAATRKLIKDADFSGLASFYSAFVDVGKGSIERTRAAAEAIRNAAGAIGIIYTGVLGLAFSTDKALPTRGLIPAVFLGLAIVFSTAFVAWLPRTVEDSEVDWPNDTDHVRVDLRNRTDMFLKWVREGTLRRRSYLRGAVLALGFAIAFLPVAFLSLGSKGTPAGSESSTTPWPTPSSEAGSDNDLQKILYQAQVDERAEIRNLELQSTPGESRHDPVVLAAYVSAFLALALTLYVGLKGRS
jgi:hypothetical protein